MRAFFVLLAAALAMSCDRASPEPSPKSKPKPKAVSTKPDKPKKVDDKQTWRFHFADKVVAIGDLHGDLAATRAALRLAGAINSEDDWIGGKLVVVQTGDQLDRGNEEREILELLNKLESQAKVAGGALHILNGNHETMNVAGDFRYVTPDGLRDFYSEQGNQPQAMRLPAPARGRGHAFFPGGTYADMLAKRNTIVIVGDTIFAHGGVLPEHVDYGIGYINSEVRAWMRGKKRSLPEVMVGNDSPVWTRRYSAPEPTDKDCAVLRRALSKLKVVRMVVGHTVQKDGITSACRGKIWRIDVGMAEHYGGDSIQALLIHQGRATVLSGTRSELLSGKRSESVPGKGDTKPSQPAPSKGTPGKPAAAP